MPAHGHAYYNPQKNLIGASSGLVLQVPFYDLHQSSSATTVVSERSSPMRFLMCFDTNGASLMKMVALTTGGRSMTLSKPLPSDRAVIDQFEGLWIPMVPRSMASWTVSENGQILSGGFLEAKKEADFLC